MKRFSFKNFFSRTSSERRKRGRAQRYNATILIVDDSRTVVHVLKTLLVKAGFKALTAMTGEQGISMAKIHKPDLILMDLVMPGINGFQATRMIRQDPLIKDIPIVIISGNEQAAEKFWGIRIGANGFLAKPITREKFFETIDEILNLESIAS
ncbi:MAG: response regulator [Gammaproteobacteria bacterium]|nr:response regulator [Gammaproteobacteria bacterium]